MSLYIGADFHPRQQTVAWYNTQTGETRILNLLDNRELVTEFYQQLSPVIIGIEASVSATWFKQLLNELGH